MSQTGTGATLDLLDSLVPKTAGDKSFSLARDRCFCLCQNEAGETAESGRVRVRVNSEHE